MIIINMMEGIGTFERDFHFIHYGSSTSSKLKIFFLNEMRKVFVFCDEKKKAFNFSLHRFFLRLIQIRWWMEKILSPPYKRENLIFLFPTLAVVIKPSIDSRFWKKLSRMKIRNSLKKMPFISFFLSTIHRVEVEAKSRDFYFVCVAWTTEVLSNQERK